MGIKDLFNKYKQKFIFIIDKETFKRFLLEQIKFAQENDLEEVEEIFLYVNGEKKTIDVTNDLATKKISFIYGGLSYQDMDGFLEQIIDPLPGEYFKIELNWSNSKILNDFKTNHPELKPEDF